MVVFERNDRRGIDLGKARKRLFTKSVASAIAVYKVTGKNL